MQFIKFPSLCRETVEPAKEDDKPVVEAEAEKKPEVAGDATTGEGAVEPVKEEEEDNVSFLSVYRVNL